MQIVEPLGGDHYGHRLGGIHADRVRCGEGHLVPHVDQGCPPVPPPVDDRPAGGEVSGPASAHHCETAAAQRFRDVVGGRQIQDGDGRGQGFRLSRCPVAEPTYDLLGVGGRVEEVARVHRAHIGEGDLHRGDHTEAAGTPALQSPEDVRETRVADADRRPVGDHEIEGAHGVRRQPEPSAEPTETAAEGVADRADDACRTHQRRKAVRNRGVEHRLPGGAGGDASGPGDRVDGHRGEPGRVDEQAAIGRHPGPVTGGLDRDPQILLGGEPHGFDDVEVILGNGDDRRAVDDESVESGACLAEARVPGAEDRAGDPVTQLCEHRGAGADDQPFGAAGR